MQRWRSGGCHCGGVRFEVLVSDAAEVEDCNCSMCRRVGFLHLIVPRDRFRQLKGEAIMTEYRFNTGAARHLFCSVCGVKAFYVPRSNPDGISVNARCFDDGEAPRLTIAPFDGVNWEANAASLKHKSQSTHE